MKVFSKFLMVAMATILFAGLASATPVGCTITSGNGGQIVDNTSNTPVLTLATYSCGAITPVGQTITSVTLAVTDTGQITGGVTGTTYGISATVTNNSAASLSNPVSVGLLINCVGNGNGACVAGPGFSSATTGLNLASLLAFTVTVTGANPGSALLNNATASVTYDYTSVPNQTGVPEPASFAMIGGGLLALAAFARRRRA